MVDVEIDQDYKKRTFYTQLILVEISVVYLLLHIIVVLFSGETTSHNTRSLMVSEQLGQRNYFLDQLRLIYAKLGLYAVDLTVVISGHFELWNIRIL